jgi:excisionase family DNA binding protein
MRKLIAPAPKSYLSRSQLAAVLGLSLRTIDNLLAAGTLPHFRIGKCIRFDLSEVEETLRRTCRVEAAPVRA